MSEWWGHLSGDLQFFYATAILATLGVLIQAALMLLGGDVDGDVHLDAASDGADGGLHILSVRSVVAFFVGFGWGGAVPLEYGMSFAAACAIAFACGAALMLGVFGLMRGMTRLNYSGNVDYRNAVGQVATVYLPIPPKREGVGQVQVTVQGRLATIHALTDCERSLGNTAQVKVVGMVGDDTLLVEPV